MVPSTAPSMLDRATARRAPEPGRFYGVLLWVRTRFGYSAFGRGGRPVSLGTAGGSTKRRPATEPDRFRHGRAAISGRCCRLALGHQSFRRTPVLTKRNSCYFWYSLNAEILTSTFTRVEIMVFCAQLRSKWRMMYGCG